MELNCKKLLLKRKDILIYIIHIIQNLEGIISKENIVNIERESVILM